MRRETGPWNAAALPEIMAGALQEGKRGVPETFHEDRAAGQQPSSAPMAKQQASNQEAPPEHAQEEPQKPERGLTLRLTGVPKARPS